MLPSLFMYGVVPLAGISLYAWLCRGLQKRVADPPYIVLLLVLISYGGCLLLAGLLVAYKYGGWSVSAWSDVMWLWGFYLLLAAPLVMLLAAFSLRQSRHLSIYHRWLYRASVGYVVLVGGWLLLLILKEALS